MLPGIHHVTSIAGDPQANVDFYIDVLGLRFVKRTVNFDDPTTYHLYYGDAVGTPGTAITFFPSERGRAGRAGAGQVTTTAFRIPPDAVDYWTDRFDRLDVDHDDPRERFGDAVVAFRDHDGLEYELVADAGPDEFEPWGAGPVPGDHAIRGFAGVTLTVASLDPTEAVLDLLGFARAREDQGGDRVRFAASDEPGSVVDVVVDPDAPRGAMGVGCVHHVAFRTPDDDTQAEWRERLVDAGLQVTEVKDRQYFRSIYFREPGGVLFEIATEGPGFTRDESREELGTSLKLPPWLEDRRGTIESALTELDVGRAAATEGA